MWIFDAKNHSVSFDDLTVVIAPIPEFPTPAVPLPSTPLQSLTSHAPGRECRQHPRSDPSHGGAYRASDGKDPQMLSSRHRNRCCYIHGNR